MTAIRRALRALWRLLVAPVERRWIAIGVDDGPIYRTAADTADGAARLALHYGEHFLRVEQISVMRHRGSQRSWIEVG